MATTPRTLSQRIEALASTWMEGGHKALSRGDVTSAARCFEKARFWAARQSLHAQTGSRRTI